jgi:D-beta-D-heptose 7-phosphate kinase / D-beta-D-heptose 1-phosphate adenosyltransferase
MHPRDKILVLGDVMLDRRIEGKMTRVSPEAPCPIVRVSQFTQGPGGAGNVAVNLASLVAHPGRVRVMGVIGGAGEEAGCTLTQLLREAGCMVRLCNGLGSTCIKTRVTCDGQQVLRLDAESPPLSADDVMYQALASLLHEQTDVQLVVVADYNKGAIPPGLAQWLVATCTRWGIPVFVDARPVTIPAYTGASLLKINLAEAMAAGAELVHPALATPNKVDQAVVLAPWLCQRYRLGAVVITVGDDGAVGWCPGQPGDLAIVDGPQTPCCVFDVTGAGDTFMAALATGFVHGWSLAQGIHRANLAAGLAVVQRGTYTVPRDEWDEAILEDSGWAGKIMSREDALLFVARRRRAGHTIVFTNGCFDLLHCGHLHLLQQARMQGHTLVVGVNTDDSIRRQGKGPGRPVLPQQARLAALSQLDTVDCVIPFDDTSVIGLVRDIRPDVLVKGGEYAGGRQGGVVGEDEVAAHGGRVVLASMLPGVSTTGVAHAVYPSSGEHGLFSS